MSVHLCKLMPPRASFPADITSAEAELMQEHFAYWSGLAEDGVALVVGPVPDPAGVWGLAIVEVVDEAAAAALTAADPVIRAGAGFRYDIHPIPQAILRPGTIPA